MDNDNAAIMIEIKPLQGPRTSRANIQSVFRITARAREKEREAVNGEEKTKKINGLFKSMARPQ